MEAQLSFKASVSLSCTIVKANSFSVYPRRVSCFRRNQEPNCSIFNAIPGRVLGFSSIRKDGKTGILFDCWNPFMRKTLSFSRLDKTTRNFVRRSELTGSGNPDGANPFTDSYLGSKLRGICFYCITSIVAICLFVVMLLVHPFVLLFDRYRRSAHHLIAKVWASLSVFPFFKVEFEGLENLPPPNVPAVYVSNHQSFLDIYTLLILGRSFKFISKTGIFLFPVVGWAMFLMGVIPLRRMDNRSQLECLKRCMDLVRKGTSVFFFPEGTRSKDGKLGVFKKGAFNVAAKAGVPTVPITLLGTGKLMPNGMEGTLSSGSVKVIIHKPIEGNNADILCSEVRAAIAHDFILHGDGVH